MNWQDVDITTGAPALSMWPPIIYYIVSIVIGGLLFIGKYFVHRYANFTVFFIYALFVPLIAGVQLSLMRFGDDFARDVLRVSLDVSIYDSIYYGALSFFVLYLFAMPTKFK